MSAVLVAGTRPDDDRATWMEARASRVTASRIHDIAVGGRSTWQRILADMLNGETFKGNASTGRGRVREAFLIDYAREFIDASIEPNAVLYVYANDERLGATPDGLGDGFGVEVKSLDFGATGDDVPAEHYDQMQFGMLVTGHGRWLYGREVMGEDGEPTLDEPTFKWIARDERRIAALLREALRFLAWREAGAPAADEDLPAELDDALALWADARGRKKNAEADEASADKVIRAHIDSTEGADKDGLKVAGRAAQFVFAVAFKEDLDTEAWATAEPESYAAWQAAQAAVAETATTAARLYHKTVRSTRLNLAPTKEAA